MVVTRAMAKLIATTSATSATSSTDSENSVNSLNISFKVAPVPAQEKECSIVQSILKFFKQRKAAKEALAKAAKITSNPTTSSKESKTLEKKPMRTTVTTCTSTKMNIVGFLHDCAIRIGYVARALPLIFGVIGGMHSLFQIYSMYKHEEKIEVLVLRRS